MAERKYFLTSIEDGVGIIQLNHPEKKNALGWELHEGIIDVLREWEDDDAVSCVLFIGNEDYFCAGWRLDVLNTADSNDRRKFNDLALALMRSIYDFGKPSLAAVAGVGCLQEGRVNQRVIKSPSLHDSAAATEYRAFSRQSSPQRERQLFGTSGVRSLGDLHRVSKQDKWVFLRAAPAVLLARLRGVPIMTGINPHLGDAYIGVPPEVGRLLYLTARAINAKQVVEFGTSFGISALYLAAAMRDNGGWFIGSETEANKIAVARANLDRAGLSACSEVRAGDALETFQDLAGPVDLVLLDGWKDLYLPMLKLLTPKLRRGSVVIADNIFTFKTGLVPYVEHMQNPANGFRSTTLTLGEGIEYSVFENGGGSA